MRFLLIYDTKGWAFWRWANGVCAHHGSDHEFTSMPASRYSGFREDVEWQSQWDAVLHFSWYEALIFPGVKRNVAMVAHHGYQFPYIRNPWKLCADWRLLASTPSRNLDAAPRLGRFDGLLAANRFIEADLKSRGYDRVFYAPGGVDTSRFCPQPTERLDGVVRVGWCAQHDDDFPNNKGWRVLEKVRAAFEGRADIEFAVNNSMSNQSPIPAEEMPDWYRSLDLFVVTSVSEGTPLTALEAMACGVPVIGTKVGILPHLIVHGETGFLFAPCRNDESANRLVWEMVSLIGKLSENPEWRRRIGEESSSLVPCRWAWRHRAADYVTALEAVCDAAHV